MWRSRSDEVRSGAKLTFATLWLFQHFHPDHFDSCIADIDDLEFVVTDDNPVFEARDGLVLIDDVTGERFRAVARQFQPVFPIDIIKLQPAGEDKLVV